MLTPVLSIAAPVVGSGGRRGSLMAPPDICAHCGGAEADHHAFVPIRIPDGCQCEPRDWGDPTNIPAVCEAFAPMSGDHDVCATCEHDAACHRAVQEARG